MMRGSLGRLGPVAIVAEDDAAARQLLATWLEHAGYRVHATVDGTELLERLDELASKGLLDQHFLVVTDVDMPRTDGLSALARLRPRFSKAVVVLVTAFGDFSTRQRARALGAVAVLDKPFQLGVLTEIAERALRAATERAVSGVRAAPRHDNAGDRAHDDQNPNSSSAGSFARRGP
jgi:CheY-like chemotaxis protein